MGAGVALQLLGVRTVCRAARMVLSGTPLFEGSPDREGSMKVLVVDDFRAMRAILSESADGLASKGFGNCRSP